MLKNNQDLYNECDMLKGNINRMCTTDDIKDLFVMYTFALRRVINIFEYSYQKLQDREKFND